MRARVMWEGSSVVLSGRLCAKRNLGFLLHKIVAEECWVEVLLCQNGVVVTNLSRSVFLSMI